MKDLEQLKQIHCDIGHCVTMMDTIAICASIEYQKLGAFISSIEAGLTGPVVGPAPKRPRKTRKPKSTSARRTKTG